MLCSNTIFFQGYYIQFLFTKAEPLGPVPDSVNLVGWIVATRFQLPSFVFAIIGHPEALKPINRVSISLYYLIAVIDLIG